MTNIRTHTLDGEYDLAKKGKAAFFENFPPVAYSTFLYEQDMNICDLIIKYTDDIEFFLKYFEECQKVRPLNEPSKKLGRTYAMVCSQFGSVFILKILTAKYSNIKLDILDSMGRGIFAIAKDEYTRFVVLAIVYKQPGMMNLDEDSYYKVKQASDGIKDIWKVHLKSDDLDSFKAWLDPVSIWDLIGVDGYSLLHAAAQNRTGRASDDKMDLVYEKFTKNAINTELIEINMGRSPVLMALQKNYAYAVCRLTVNLEDVAFIAPDIEGHSLDFYIKDFAKYQGENCTEVVKKFGKSVLEKLKETS